MFLRCAVVSPNVAVVVRVAVLFPSLNCHRPPATSAENQPRRKRFSADFFRAAVKNQRSRTSVCFFLMVRSPLSTSFLSAYKQGPRVSPFNSPTSYQLRIVNGKSKYISQPGALPPCCPRGRATNDVSRSNSDSFEPSLSQNGYDSFILFLNSFSRHALLPFARSVFVCNLWRSDFGSHPRMCFVFCFFPWLDSHCKRRSYHPRRDRFDTTLMSVPCWLFEFISISSLVLFSKDE